MAEIVHGILIRLLRPGGVLRQGTSQRMDALAGEEAPSEYAV
jgi:hypothetical protein